MTGRILTALAVLVATSPVGWCGDKAKAKKKKQPPAVATAAPKSKWEYKLVRADELVPAKGVSVTTTATAGSPDGKSASPGGTATTVDARGRLADALNKLGEEGWELVWVDAPARPAGSGMAGGLGGGGAAGFAGGLPNADQVWEAIARGKDKIDLDALSTDDRTRSRVERFGLPTEGTLTKEKFKEAYEKRMADTLGDRRGGASFGGMPPVPPPVFAATYFFKREKN